MKPEKNKSIDELQSHTVEVINSLPGESKPLVISQDGEPKAVLRDYASYVRTCEIVELLKSYLNGEPMLIDGNAVSDDELFHRIREEAKCFIVKNDVTAQQ